MPDKIRILHVVPGLGHGGAEHQLLLNVRHLDQGRFQNYVCHLHDSRALAPEIEADGTPVYSAFASGAFGWVKRVKRLVGLVRQLNIDIIHGSNVEGEIYAGLAGKLTGRPVISTLTNVAYGDVWLQDNPNLTRWKLRLTGMYRKLVLRALHRRYVAISEYVKRSTVEGFGLNPQKIDVIFRGASTDLTITPREMQEQLREELGIRRNQFVILNVGRLVPQKGQRYLLKAMPLVAKAVPEAVLLLAGVGFLEDSLKSLADSLGLGESVKFLGSRDDVPNLLAIADVFVFPSLFEGFGVALLEAAMDGKAIVASNAGPIPEILDDGESGLLVEPGDVEGLAARLARLAEDPGLRDKLGSQARASSLDRFSIERAVAKLERVYESMVKT